MTSGSEQTRLEHRGRGFVLEPIRVGLWKIVSEDGRNHGTLTVVSESGEEGDPVYAAHLPSSAQAYTEGSDWAAMVRAVINAVEDAEDEG